jgi:integrase
MKGYIGKKGSAWRFGIDVGVQPAQRCASEACRRVVVRRGREQTIRPLYWIEKGKRLKACPSCGGELLDGRERRLRWVAGFKTKKQAEAALAQAIAKRLNGQEAFPPTMTFAEYVERWLQHKRRDKRLTTIRRYEGLLRDHILPVLGGIRVADVRPAEVQITLDRMSEGGQSARSVIQARAVISGALKAAVDWQLIPLNPARAAKAPSPQRPALQVPSPEGLLALVRAAEGTPWAIPMLVACSTGLRRAEALALRWADLDLGAGRLTVRQTAQRTPEGISFVEPKTPRSLRTIDLPRFALERLRRHKAEQAARRLAVGAGWRDLDLVSDNGVGEPLDPDAWSHAFKRLALKAGLSPKMRLHDCRHGVASALLAKNVHPAIASAVLGHARVAFTMDTYQHLLDGMTAQAAKALDEAFGT